MPLWRECNKEDQIKTIWFSESSRNRSSHGWAACLLKRHWIQSGTVFGQVWATLLRQRDRHSLLAHPVYFSWWTQPDRVQQTLWEGADWYQLASCSAQQRASWHPIDKRFSYLFLGSTCTAPTHKHLCLCMPVFLELRNDRSMISNFYQKSFFFF